MGGRVFARCTVPKSMHSDLSEFNTKPYYSKAYRSRRQSSTRDMFDNAVAIQKQLCTFVSSANCWWKMACSDIISEIGEIYRVKTGPRTEPWGTPILHGLWVDVEPCTRTNKLRTIRQIWSEPLENQPINNKTSLQPGYENIMINQIKCSTEIQGNK